MIGILLINLGTPAGPSIPAVRKYLREFLSDPRVIDINPLARWLLVNLIIAPFRSPKSAAAYKKIWTYQGSPILRWTQVLREAVARKLGGGFVVEMGMRYGKPSIEEALARLQENNLEEIRVLPLYPQYASSTTESSVAKVFKIAKKLKTLAPLQILSPFFDHPGFVQSFAEIGRSLLEKFKPDHILFSFHGLPERQILKADVGKNHCLKSPHCCDEIIPANGLCYRAHCFQSARAIAAALELNSEEYSIAFQSRLGRTPWIKPYTDLVLQELVKSGKKRIAVFCPSFVADCLETLEEVGIRYRELVEKLGGELLLIPSLNDSPQWVETVCQMLSPPTPNS